MKNISRENGGERRGGRLEIHRPAIRRVGRYRRRARLRRRCLRDRLLLDDIAIGLHAFHAGSGSAMCINGTAGQDRERHLHRGAGAGRAAEHRQWRGEEGNQGQGLEQCAHGVSWSISRCLIVLCGNLHVNSTPPLRSLH
jgi:hypothetical protein